VVRFAAVLAGGHALAEDIVQEVLIRVHARWGGPDRAPGCARGLGPDHRYDQDGEDLEILFD
jgi:hypothetical protein